MGYMRHHAIVVIGWDEKAVRAAHEKAEGLFLDIAPVTPITPETTNGYRSFMVAPDGSKEGWDHSERGDIARGVFRAWLREGPSVGRWLEWVEIEMPEDKPATISAADGEYDENNI